jgi:glutamate N-acetyltransferase/amino-acid N-acetyltransferase
VVVRIQMGTGPGSATALGCDLGYEYVRINGEYTT